jgi:hypothetical protein
MDCIVNASYEMLESLPHSQKMQLQKRLLEPGESSLNRWRLCREIDYVIWSQARLENRGRFRDLAIISWILRDGSFVREATGG